MIHNDVLHDHPSPVTDCLAERNPARCKMHGYDNVYQSVTFMQAPCMYKADALAPLYEQLPVAHRSNLRLLCQAPR